MKKLILSVAVCLLFCSLFVGMQPVFATPGTLNASSGTKWEQAEKVTPDVYTSVINFHAFDQTVPNYQLGVYDTVTDSKHILMNISDLQSSFSVSDSYLLTDNLNRTFQLTDPTFGFYLFYDDGNTLTDNFYYDYTASYMSAFDYALKWTTAYGELNFIVSDASPVPTPVPTAAILLGSGLVGLVGFRRKLLKN
jgi:hypothetical protein